MPEIEQVLQSFRVISDKQWPKKPHVSCRGVWSWLHRAFLITQAVFNPLHSPAFVSYQDPRFGRGRMAKMED